MGHGIRRSDALTRMTLQSEAPPAWRQHEPLCTQVLLRAQPHMAAGRRGGEEGRWLRASREEDVSEWPAAQQRLREEQACQLDQIEGLHIEGDLWSRRLSVKLWTSVCDAVHMLYLVDLRLGDCFAHVVVYFLSLFSHRDRDRTVCLSHGI